MTQLLKRVAVLIFAVALSGGLLTTGAATASGAINCTNKSHDWAKYSTYVDRYGRNVPLRCGYWNGSKGWGVVKLKHKGRWNVWYRDMIGATLENPSQFWNQNPTTDVYVTAWQTDCDPVYRFRVVVNTGHKKGETGMMGVVNAYKELR